MFTEGYAAAGMFASADAMQVCFTEIASAYLNSPRTFIEDHPDTSDNEAVTFEEIEVFGDSVFENTLWETTTKKYAGTWIKS